MRSVEGTVPGIANENFPVDSLYHRILLGLEEIPSVFGSGRKGTAALSQAKSPDVSQDTSSFRVTPTANATEVPCSLLSKTALLHVTVSFWPIMLALRSIWGISGSAASLELPCWFRPGMFL